MRAQISVFDALDACQRIYQSLKKKAGMLGRLASKGKCDLRDLLRVKAEHLQSIYVADTLRPGYVSSAAGDSPSRRNGDPAVDPDHEIRGSDFGSDSGLCALAKPSLASTGKCG